MAEPLSAEEEAHARSCVAIGAHLLRRTWATLDAARAERDEARAKLEALGWHDDLMCEREREITALRALADAVEADATLDKTREYLRRHGPIVSDYAPHLRPIPLALAAVRAAQGPR